MADSDPSQPSDDPAPDRSAPPPPPPPLDYAGPHPDESDVAVDPDEPNQETWTDFARALGLVVFLLIAFILMLTLTCGGGACLVGA